MALHQDQMECLRCGHRWGIPSHQNEGLEICPQCNASQDDVNFIESDLEWCDDPDCTDPAHAAWEPDRHYAAGMSYACGYHD